MKFKGYIYCLAVAIVTAVCYCATPDAEAATRTKARTTSSTKKKSSSKRRTTSSKKRTAVSSSSKRTKSSGTKRRKSTASRTRKSTPKKTTVSTPVERPSDDPLTLQVNSAILEWMPKDQNPGGLRVNRVTPNSRQGTVGISLNENFMFFAFLFHCVGGILKAWGLPVSPDSSDLSFPSASSGSSASAPNGTMVRVFSSMWSSSK